MKLRSSILRNSLFVFAVTVALPMLRVSAQTSGQSSQAQSDAAAATASAQSAAVPSRITQAIDEKQLVTLKGNVHPLARPEFDQGAAPDSTTINRGVILLQRSADQETALRKLLDDQQSKNSPNFHKWLTPDQFGTQFGPSDSDVQTVTEWLTQKGFHDVKVGAGKLTVEFSGNVAQVRSAFHTDIHQFVLNGEAHLANASEAQVPAAIAPVIAGVYGLHNFRPKSLRHKIQNLHIQPVTKDGKLVTFHCGSGSSSTPCFGLSPADFAKIYNIPATVKGVAPGTGVSIAIVQDSNLLVTDVQQYRTLFGLSGTFDSGNIILNGPDPGVQDPTTVSGDETEADLDAELAGGIAPGATVKVVVSENSDSLGVAGIDLSALYIIQNNIAPIMSESFGSCETATNGTEPFYSVLWEQAASQGITVLVSTGDSGSDACDASSGLDFATTGLSINGIASTPFNVALGGTDFVYGGNPSTYWGAGTPTESALSYIPESTWNSGCAATATTGSLSTCTSTIINQNTANGNLADIEGGGGGQSAVSANTRPPWQTGITPAADSRRDIPDISLFSAVNSNSNTFIIMCEGDVPTVDGGQGGAPCAISNTSVAFLAIGGTSAAAPAFAGIMSMVVQQQGGDPAGRQGNANHVLYNIYNQNKSTASKVCQSTAANVATGTCIFYDTVTGNNSVACQGGTTNCSNTSTAASQYGVLVDPAATTTPAFSAVAGYDKATGLGSVNVTNLLAAWSSGSLPAPHVTVTSPQASTTIAHGASATFTITVAQTSGTTVPTGDVSLIVTPAGGQPFAIGTFNNNLNLASNFGLNGSGTLTFSTVLLPGGTDSIVAQYGGDSNFAAAQSSPITITVNKESSVTTSNFLTLSNDGTFDANLTGSPIYGTTPYILRVDVSNSGGFNNACSLANSVLPCPTGTITLTDNGHALNDFPNSQTGTFTNVANLTTLGFLEDQPINLTGGSHSIVAAYSGDSSFSASTSSAVAITVTAAPTATTVAANPSSNITTSTPVTLSATIATAQSGGNGPTGTVTFSAGGSTIGTASVVPTNASNPNSATQTAAFGTATTTHTFSTAGSYTISASYATGDTNYTGSVSSGAGNASITVTAGGGGGGTSTTTTLTSSPTSISSGGSVTLTATVVGSGTGGSPSGTVGFSNGSTSLSTGVTCAAVSGAPPTCKATLTTTLAFLTPPAAPMKIPPVRVLPVILVTLAMLLVFLLTRKYVPAPYRRRFAFVSLLLLVGILAGFSGCGSSGGGGTHTDTITATYSGDATYSGSSGSVQVTVQ